MRKFRVYTARLLKLAFPLAAGIACVNCDLILCYIDESKVCFRSALSTYKQPFTLAYLFFYSSTGQ